MENVDATIELLERLIRFETVSVRSNLDLIGHVADYLDRYGVKPVLTQDATGQKANLFATIGPEVDGGVVLSGHTDVVPVEGQDWENEPFVLTRRDDLLYGRGSADMKGFIACALIMVPRFLEMDLRRPVHFAFSFDEEIGCLGVPLLLEELSRGPFRPGVAIIGEPSEMRIIAGHKGGYELKTEFKGVEAHASNPEKGVSAIAYAAEFIAYLSNFAETLKAKADPAVPFEPPYTTFNVGTIHGGVARNTIAGKCVMEWEMRPIPGDDGDELLRTIDAHVEQNLLPAMRAADPGAGIRTVVEASYPGLEPVPDSEAIRLVRELIGEDTCELVSFGTEAGLFQQAGMATVICGPGSIHQAHKPNEFIHVEQLAACLRMLERLAHRLSDDE